MGTLSEVTLAASSFVNNNTIYNNFLKQHVHVVLCVHECSGCGSQSVSYLLEVGYRQAWAAWCRCWGTKPGCSAGAIQVLNHWALFPAPVIMFNGGRAHGFLTFYGCYKGQSESTFVCFHKTELGTELLIYQHSFLPVWPRRALPPHLPNYLVPNILPFNERMFKGSS